MKLAVFGANEIGLTASAVFASHGHQVVCTDENRSQIETLNAGTLPIQENGLAQLILEAQEAGNLSFSVNRLTAASESDYLLFTEVIPVDENDSPDLSAFFRFIRQIAITVHTHKTFIIKSTVPPGTATMIEEILIEQGLTDRSFDVVSNPDFIRKGTAIFDFLHPAKIIVGTSSLRGCRMMERFYAPISQSLYYMDHSSAELMRYAYHTYLSLKVSCLTMIAGVAETYGADVEAIQTALPKESYFNEHSLYPGSCFLGSEKPSEIASFRSMIQGSSSANRMFEALEGIDQYQPEVLIQKLKDFLGTLQGVSIALMSSTTVKAIPSIPTSELVIKRLEEEGAIVKMYNLEKAGDRFRENSSTPLYKIIADCEALLLMTEKESLQNVNWKQIVKKLKLPLIVDGHNLFSLEEMRKIANTYDLIYCSIGRPNIYKGLGSISVQSVQ
ncbi:MAG: nucleotide sugar dehydrogenase [Anaerobacillus sp.]